MQPSQKESSQKSSLALGSFKIFAGTGINLDLVAYAQEQRYLNNGAGLEGSGLKNVGSSIAAEAGIGLGDLKVNERGGLYAEYVALVGQDLADHVLFNELEAVGKNIGTDGDLVIGLGIHEIVQIAVIVQVFHVLALNISLFEFVSGVESSFNNGSGYDVLHLGTHESGTLTRFNMLEFYDLHDLAVHLESYSVSEIAGRKHL